MLSMPAPMLTVGIVFLVAFAVLPEARGDEPVPPERDNKLRVMIVTGGHDFEREAFFEVFSGHPDVTWFEVQHPDVHAMFAPGRTGEYDVMVWYDMHQDISDAAKRNLVNLLEQGKPLVVLHHAMANYQAWPEAKRIIGGRYHLEASDAHRASTFHHDVDFTVKIADPDHPITRFMDDFEIHDETYNHFEVLPHVTPLLKTDHPRSGPVIGWTHEYGNSRVATIQLGHDSHAFNDPNFRRLIIQSIRWTAGRLPDPSEEGFRPIFNGRDLEGWTVVGDPEGFHVSGGILRSDVPYKGKWLRSDRLYGDFILRIEWRVSEGGNSGVFVRSATDGHPWVTGSEVQISNTPRDIAHCTGSLYGTVAVDPRPDETAEVWHEFEIHCRGPRYRVFADNIPVVDVDARQVPALYAKPFIGHVGVQDSHADDAWIEYRNIRIKELKMVDGDTTPWKLGVQTYTFNRFTLFEAIDKARELGLRYIEAYPGQRLSPDQRDVSFSHNSPVEVLDQVKRKLADTGISLVAFGVVVPKADEQEIRGLFEFARIMGIQTITAEPELDAMDLLDRYTAEYGINLAIHNHPRPTRYWDPSFVLENLEGRNPRMGVCADVGHWMRSGLDPVEGLRKVADRLISLHFGDLTERAPGGHDVPWGTGQGDVKGMMAELHRQGFEGLISVEYEHNWDNNQPEVAESIKYFRQVEKELGRGE